MKVSGFKKQGGPYMDKDKKSRIFLCKTNPLMREFFAEKAEFLYGKDEQEFPPVNPDYAMFNLDEIAYLSKEDHEASNELTARLNCQFLVTARKMVAIKKNLTVDDVVFELDVLINKVVVKFDPEVGKFIHLFRAMANRSIIYLSCRESEKYKREKSVLGQKVSLDSQDIPCFNDASKDTFDFSSFAIKLDLDEFIETIPINKREMFILYIRGMTITELSKMYSLPYTTCSSTVYSLREAFLEKINGKK